MLARVVSVWKADGMSSKGRKGFDVSMSCLSHRVCWCQSKVLDAPLDCLGLLKIASLDGESGKVRWMAFQAPKI